MTQSNTHLNEIWTKINDVIEQVFQFKKLSAVTFLNVYNGIQRYFTGSEYNDSLLVKPSSKVSTQDKQDSSNMNLNNIDDLEMNMPSGQIYFRLKKRLKERLQIIVEENRHLTGEDFVRFYTETWELYQCLSRILNSLFQYMNRNWISRQHKEKSKEFVDVYTLAMKTWQDMFFKQNNHSLTKTCLKLIREDRENQNINVNLVRQVIQSYISADLTDAHINSKRDTMPSLTLNTYKNFFQNEFIEETIEFYSIESDYYFENYSFTDYLEKVHNRLEEEVNRVKTYLHPSTLDKLTTTLVKIQVENRLNSFYERSKELIKDENIKGLHLLYELIDRVHHAHQPIKVFFEEHVYTVGITAINCTKGTAVKDSRTYIEPIITIHERFNRLVTEAFNKDHGYASALDIACSKFINDNEIVQQSQKASQSAELLARYCDWLLRKGNKIEDRDIEQKIKQIMIVFNYIRDKDVFQKFHGKYLAKRLVEQTSVSHDYEESVISELRAMCGYEYASKLQRMFQDISLSLDLSQEYKNNNEKQDGYDKSGDFNVMVLSSNFWPFKTQPIFNMSNELLPTWNSFQRFYMKKHYGRKLDLLLQHTKGELQTLHTKSRYILQVSFYQMNILLLFNEFTVLTVEQMLDRMQIKSDIFMLNLVNLLAMKVLTCQEINSNNLHEDFQGTDILMNYHIQVNETWKNSKIKVNLMKFSTTPASNQADLSLDYRSVFEERKLAIQAAIVRIMKTRQTVKHSLLIPEVIQNLCRVFKPDIPDIKKCIDLLIEKQYMERDGQQRDLYKYVA